jgi:O-antigen/teichoic acid export membrane protein
VLVLLTAVIVPIYLNRLFHYCFISLKRQIEYTYIAGSTLLLNAVLDLILIPRIGYWGACVGALSAEIVRLLICSWRLRRHIGPVYPWKTLWRLVPPNLALAAILWALQSWLAPWAWAWIVAGAAAGLAYLALAWFAGALDQSEKGAMRLALAKIGTRSR